MDTDNLIADLDATFDDYFQDVDPQDADTDDMAQSAIQALKQHGVDATDLAHPLSVTFDSLFAVLDDPADVGTDDLAQAVITLLKRNGITTA